jgi:NAD(P)-dependent dehydrogenase (short-subunit alcohol dehydrogenase family)
MTAISDASAMNHPTHPPGGHAVVAGAPPIIVAAVGTELAGRGYRVVLGVPNVDDLEDILRSTHADVGAITCVALDLDEQRSVDSFVERSADALGDIDVLVLGTTAAAAGDFATNSPESFSRQIHVDLIESHRLAIAILPLMVPKGRGDIVFIAAGDSLPPNPHLGAFGTVEATTSEMVKRLQSELEGTGVRTGCVQIGPTSLDSGYQIGQEPRAVLRGSPARDALRHNNLLRPADIARAVTFVVEARHGSLVAALRIQPEAPICVASRQ